MWCSAKLKDQSTHNIRGNICLLVVGPWALSLKDHNAFQHSYHSSLIQSKQSAHTWPSMDQCCKTTNATANCGGHQQAVQEILTSPQIVHMTGDFSVIHCAYACAQTRCTQALSLTAYIACLALSKIGWQSLNHTEANSGVISKLQNQHPSVDWSQVKRGRHH